MEKNRINSEIKVYTDLLKETNDKGDIKELKKYIKEAKAELKQYETKQETFKFIQIF
jgi:hypothetical protein